MNSKLEKVVWRPVREDELELVMNWRMSPEITQYMYTDPVLTLEGQKKWLETTKTDPTSKTFMIEVNEIPAGIMSINDIDQRNKRCSSGYYVAVKEVRSLELAMLLEWTVYDYAFEHLKLHKVIAEVFSENKAVVRIHQMCGSVVEGEFIDHIYKYGKFFNITSLAITAEKWKEEKQKRTYKKVEIIEA
ncbi:MAG: UDP-4-amino-4,6-dideoxy-N-acetyl-beta-L-altrosamine N-acetyltransferase [Lachnospiraceae bacterium]|nr:UDP-4-amino-4,6-dideoxy-N-acetyl-beta-L-altrosamine N-acetyltransferase [Lachnospiraceae bacterium]